MKGMVRSSDAAKRNVILEVDELKPRDDIGPLRCERGEFAHGIFARLDARRGPRHLKRGPLGYFPIARLMTRVRFDPFEDSTVTLAFGQLLEQRLGFDFHERRVSFVDARVKNKTARFAGELSAAFVEETRKNHIAAET